MALQIMERREDFPGVTAELTSVREYPQPLGANAAHELGYLGPVTDAELKAARGAERRRGAKNETVLQRTDLIGRTGLEREYDDDLRGTPGVKTLAVDHQGGVSGALSETQPTAGNYLVTTIDAQVQAAAEKQLKAAIMRARHTGDINKGFAKYKADSGAVVVLDVRTGGIVAMASYPTYDPNIWVGGISSKDYKSITSKKNNYPNQSRAFQGEFAPGSTFKAISTPAAVKAGYSLNGSYPCPSAYPIGGSLKGELRVRGVRHRSRSAGRSRCPATRSSTSSPTRPGCARAGCTRRRASRTRSPRWPRRFGLGKTTGLDLPSEANGRIADRAWKKAYWKATKDFYCAKAKTGYPEVAKSDPQRAAYLLQLSKENCVDGWAYRGGDAANFAIGQGDTLVTPLQMARVYAAVANGGTLVTPHIGKAIITPEGKLVRSIEPEARPATSRSARQRCAGSGPRCARSPRSAPATGRSSGPASRWASCRSPPRPAPPRSTASSRPRGSPPSRRRQAAVRRGDDGQPGRHRVGHLRAVGRRDLQDAVRHQGPAGRPGRGRRRPGGHPTAALPAVRPDGTVVSRRRPGGRPPTGCPSSPHRTCLPPTCSPTGGTRRAGDERRLPPRALHRAAGPARLPAAAPRLGAAPDRLDAAVRGLRAVRVSAARWSGRRPGRPPSSPAATPRRSSRSTASTSPSGWCSAWWPRSSTTGCCAPTRRCSTCSRSAGWSRCCRRWGPRSTARTRGSCCRRASRSSPPSWPRSRWSSAWRCCCRRSATPRTPRATSTSCMTLAFAAVPLALVMLQPDLGTALVVSAIVLGVVAVSGAPLRWVVGPGAGRRADRVRGGAGRVCSRTTSWTGSGRSTTRRPTPRASATTCGRPRSRSARAGFTARGCSTARRPRASSCPRSRPTSSSPSRGRSSASSARRVAGAAAGRGALAGRPDRDAGRRPVRPAAGHRRALLVRLPVLREHRHDAGDHAGHRRAAAVRVLRRVLDVREHARGRPAAERAHAVRYT